MRALSRAGIRQWLRVSLPALAIFVAIPVSIATAQTITLSGNSATFASTAALPQPVSQSITITNTGAVAMTGVQISSVTYGVGQPTGWLSASNTSGPNSTIQPNSTNSIFMTDRKSVV